MNKLQEILFFIVASHMKVFQSFTVLSLHIQNVRGWHKNRGYKETLIGTWQLRQFFNLSIGKVTSAQSFLTEADRLKILFQFQVARDGLNLFSKASFHGKE
jgi:hypothetical protein